MQRTTSADRHDITVTVNGRRRQTAVDASSTLLETLREDLGLTGAKPACEVGTCGACTVIVDDIAVSSCLVLAAEVDGCSVDTVEGLADGQTPSKLQSCFASCDALQCGFCTPGQLMSLEALRRSTPNPSAEQIESAVQGNLCRCGAYRHILEAAHQAFDAKATA